MVTVPTSCQEADVWLALQDTLSEVRLLIHELLRSSRLSMGQAFTMKWIREAEGLRLSVLAEGLGISRPAATELVTSLESRGWVRRDRSPADRRGVVVRLTPRGRGLLTTLDRKVEKIIRVTLTRIPERERAPTVTTLQALRGGIHEWREHAQGGPGAKA
jgi:DNA-binding MarR family transcriptional regulator